ncbi:MAG: polysaccharide biosynthesis protein [Planctomycetota bacterium]|nr:MAG: polysaccharide biosynthesis protein [Planctomycetota bacterium]
MESTRTNKPQRPIGPLPISRGALSVSAHLLLFVLAYFCAFGLHYNFRQFGDWIKQFFVPLLPMVVIIKMIVFWRMKLFSGSWRYVGMRDMLAVVKATHISTFCFVVAFYLLERLFYAREGEGFLYAWNAWMFEGRQVGAFPQATFILDWGMTIAVVCGARILFRLYHEELRPVSVTGHRKCLIVGAGDTGEALLREILRMPVERYQVVGFLDDDTAKLGGRIHGVPVLGKIAEARTICQREEVEELFIAMPSATQRKLRAIVESLQGLNVRFRTIPAMAQVIEGRVTFSQVRDVDIKDLLGREQVELEEGRIQEYLADQRVLVTGAGGSIGSEICRQIMRYRPSRLILLERAENNLFDVDRELGAKFPDVPRICYVADITDYDRIDWIMAQEKPAVIFHAAAHKHVPLMEHNVGEAVKNNILGTKTVADAAKRHGVKRFVMISTDKAVNPTSVMGCTKRVAEMYIQQLCQGAPTQFMTVRFGNVLGSSGSVVPIFQKQIAAGGPVTVTDPRMTRYFMTIPEASQLVLQAGVMGNDGDIFVLDMGEPVKIVDLAREMITLSGLRPGDDIEIVFSGIRPGEKLYEELSVSGENMGKTTHEKIYVWRNRKEDWPRICTMMDRLVADADNLTPAELKKRLAEVVPEYVPDLAEATRADARSAAVPNAAPADTPLLAPAEMPRLTLGESAV